MSQPDLMSTWAGGRHLPTGTVSGPLDVLIPKSGSLEGLVQLRKEIPYLVKVAFENKTI